MENEETTCTGFFRANTDPETGEALGASCLDAFQASGALQWFFGNLLEAFYNIFAAILFPARWLDWLSWTGTDADKASLMQTVYYGGSVEFFFAIFLIFLVVTIVGLVFNNVLWGVVRGLEAFANTVGRVFAWAGLLMVLQQILVIFMQRVFAVSEISIGLGASFSQNVSWWSEELKFYNAMVVCLCVAYTFVQGGHVRVDLIYSAISERAKRVVDMVGALLFMLPAAVLTWMYGWYFLWRHLITPNPSASDGLDRLMMKARAVRWNVETIGFSPQGFNAYFLFKVLLCALTAMIFLQGIAFFYRSFLEWKEGPASYGKHLDRDTLGEGEEAYEGTH